MIGLIIPFLFLLMFLVFLAFFGFWIWMLVDCAKRSFDKDDEKLLWILVIVLAGVVGAAVYFFVVHQKEK